MAERIVLDPSEVATGRTQFDITDWVSSEGIDWGDAEVAAYMAEQERGSAPVDFRVPNRQIQIPLKLQARGTFTFEQARQMLQAKVARIQQEGGWLKRVTAGGGTVFADIVNATLQLGGSWMQAYRDADLEASLSLEAIPDWYGAEITLSDHVETTAQELIFTETGIQGDYPARVRVTVDNDSTTSQLGLIWGFRSKHYSNASTARLVYEAEALTMVGGSIVGLSVMSGSVGNNWSPVLSTQIAGVGHMTHTGTYRVWARMSESNSGDRQQWARFVWDVGDMTTPAANTPVQLVRPDFAVYDLGEIRLDAAPVGTHRWQGQLQGKSSDGELSQFSVEKLWFVPVDDGYGVLRASPSSELGLAAYSARDEFRQSAGALNGKVAQTGGAWATTGATTDFQVTGGTLVTRSVSTDTTNIRYATLNTNMGATVVQVDLRWDTAVLAGLWPGVLARFTDTNNYFGVRIVPNSLGYTRLIATAVVAGGATSFPVTIPWPDAGVFYTLRVMVDSAGRFWVWLFRTGSVAGAPVLSGSSTHLASTGQLAIGDPGFHDFGNTTGSVRSFKNFLAWTPAQEAVMYGSRSLELRTDGIVRSDSAGTAYGPVPEVVGNLPRLPQAGVEGRTCEVFLRASRGAYEPSSDPAADDISARIRYRPSWLTVPGT